MRRAARGAAAVRRSDAALVGLLGHGGRCPHAPLRHPSGSCRDAASLRILPEAAAPRCAWLLPGRAVSSTARPAGASATSSAACISRRAFSASAEALTKAVDQQECQLLRLFDRLDMHGNGELELKVLEAGLDTLSARVPSESKIIAQLCVALSGEHHRILRVDWQRAISEALAESEELLKGVSSRHLELAVEAMDVDRVMRRAKQRSIFGNSMALPQIGHLPLSLDLPNSWEGLNPFRQEPQDDENLTSTHQRTLLKFFEHLDKDGDGEVDRNVLEAGLDKLFFKVPRYYDLASSLLDEVGGEGGSAVRAEDWALACAEALSSASELLDSDESPGLLRQLQLAVEAMSPEGMRRKARRKVIMGRSLDVPVLEVGEFPKQRLEGISSQDLKRRGLARFEPILQGYTIVDGMLGGGAFAKVFSVKNEATGDLQALKRMDRTKIMKEFGLSEAETIKMIELEFRHLQHTDHPNIVRLLECRQDTRYSYFVMEAANGGDLKKIVDWSYGPDRNRPESSALTASRKLSEGYVAEVVRQVCHALHHLHSDSRIHKDLKLENVMLLSPTGPPHLVLIDLGMMEIMPEEEEGGKGPIPAGTPVTMAPEVIDTYLGRRPGGFDQRCDIYSLGVVAFEMLTGRQPYEEPLVGGKGSETDYEGLRQLIENMDVETMLVNDNGRSIEAAELVSRMLAVEPEKRPQAQEILRDPWLVRHAERLRLRQKKQGHGGPDAATQQGQRPDPRRAEISEAVLKFSKRSARQRSATYYLAGHMPLSKLGSAAESFAKISEDLKEEFEFEDFCKALALHMGLDGVCARYVASAADVDGSGFVDFQDFAQACASLCLGRERVLLDSVAQVLAKGGESGLSIDEVQGALERFTGRSVPRTEVASWLASKGLDVDGDVRITEGAFREHVGVIPAADEPPDSLADAQYPKAIRVLPGAAGR